MLLRLIKLIASLLLAGGMLLTTSVVNFVVAQAMEPAEITTEVVVSWSVNRHCRPCGAQAELCLAPHRYHRYTDRSPAVRLRNRL